MERNRQKKNERKTKRKDVVNQFRLFVAKIVSRRHTADPLPKWNNVNIYDILVFVFHSTDMFVAQNRFYFTLPLNFHKQ